MELALLVLMELHLVYYAIIKAANLMELALQILALTVPVLVATVQMLVNIATILFAHKIVIVFQRLV